MEQCAISPASNHPAKPEQVAPADSRCETPAIVHCIAAVARLAMCIGGRARRASASSGSYRLLAGIAAAVLVSACATPGASSYQGAADGRTEGPRRFALTPLTEMTPEQRAVADAIMKGPRAAAGSPAAAAGATSLSSPFNVWNRRPELADHLQKLGETIRFKSSLPPRLNEFAILITARHWDAQYEWFAHHRLAMAGGLAPAVAEDLRNGRVPAGMKPDEQVVYDFTTELHERHGVSDATYKRAVDAFGEQGVADLIAVNGYYVLVAMTVNVDRTPMPGNAPLPLPRLVK
jgi:4-carboxymuconolactone decarboxylase